MAIKIINDIKDLKLGDILILKVYRGGDLIWPIINPYAVSSSEAKYGDVLFCNKKTLQLEIGSYGADLPTRFPSNDYEPIGIVVVPASHGRYGDYNTCGCMSLRVMDGQLPDTGRGGENPQGSLEYPELDLSDYGSVDNLDVYDYLLGTNIDTNQWLTYNVYNGSYNSIPELTFPGCGNMLCSMIEGVGKSVICGYDPLTRYLEYSGDVAIPSPYLLDESLNHYASTEIANSKNIATGKCDGYKFTKTILNYISNNNSYFTNSDWQTCDNLSDFYNLLNSQDAKEFLYDFALILCSWRFHTLGTNLGDWYIPSLGELMYLTSRWGTFSDILASLKNLYTINLYDTYFLNMTHITSSTCGTFNNNPGVYRVFVGPNAPSPIVASIDRYNSGKSENFAFIKVETTY